jgi:hypothetical protein
MLKHSRIFRYQSLEHRKDTKTARKFEIARLDYGNVFLTPAICKLLECGEDKMKGMSSALGPVTSNCSLFIEDVLLTTVVTMNLNVSLVGKESERSGTIVIHQIKHPISKTPGHSALPAERMRKGDTFGSFEQRHRLKNSARFPAILFLYKSGVAC